MNMEAMAAPSRAPADTAPIAMAPECFIYRTSLESPQDDDLFPLIELILRPGILFWGFETQSSELS